MKLSLFADGMIVHMENPRDSTKKLLDLMNLAKQLDTKSILRNQRHSCTPAMKDQKRKSGKKIPFDIATRKIKYMGINLTKEAKNLLRKVHHTKERN